MHKLAYDQGETVGWPQLADTVADVYRELPGPKRADVSIFTANYGEAGAVAVYGRALGLPQPLSGQNNYYLWGPGTAPDATVIAVNAVGQLRPFFNRCVYATTCHSPHDVNNDENGGQVWICIGPRGPWRSFWTVLRHYG